jgi:Domain of unknown function (DUF4189)
MPSAKSAQRSQVPIIAAVVGVILLLGGAVIAAVVLLGKSNNGTKPAAGATTTSETTEESATTTTTTRTTASSQPPVNTGAKFVVIYYDPATGAVGWSNNANTKDQASQLALNYCKQYGGTNCQEAAWASDGCAAVAKSNTTWHGGYGPTIDAAEKNAVSENKGGTIVFSKCST